MKRLLLYLLFIPYLLSGCTSSENNYTTTQKVINVEYPSEGSIVFSEKMSFPKIKSGYTLWLPKEVSKGLIVFLDEYRDTVNKTPIIDLGLKNQLAILFVTTNNPAEFLFEESKMKELEGYIYEAISKNNIPKNNMLYCGMSLAGTRALKLAAAPV